MRGKVSPFSFSAHMYGIAPAYAGKRAKERNTERVEEDHPRVCGEKRRTGLQVTKQTGSPPRMRGKAQDWLASDKANRITPAYAGKSAGLACK